MLLALSEPHKRARLCRFASFIIVLREALNVFARNAHSSVAVQLGMRSN